MIKLAGELSRRKTYRHFRDRREEDQDDERPHFLLFWGANYISSKKKKVFLGCVSIGVVSSTGVGAEMILAGFPTRPIYRCPRRAAERVSVPKKTNHP